MQVTELSTNSFSLSGTCPHCQCKTVLTLVGGPASEPGPESRLIGLYICAGCRDYIWARIQPAKETHVDGIVHRVGARCLNYYPQSKADEFVPDDVPEHIAEDLKEALRCRHAQAPNATAEMCRRVLEAACILKGAPKVKLYKQIEWLHEQGEISKQLRQTADKIRLIGNNGAHPPELNDEAYVPVTLQHADAVLAFTREFLNHLFVIPAHLERISH